MIIVFYSFHHDYQHLNLKKNLILIYWTINILTTKITTNDWAKRNIKVQIWRFAIEIDS